MTDSRRPWRTVAADLWHVYRCIVRECRASSGNPWHTFQARAALLALHAAVVLMLLWWVILGYALVAVAKAVLG